jgi:hypothetical protein
MAKHIVIDWQRDSLLAAIVNGHGAKGTVTQTFEEEFNTSIGDGLRQAVLKASGQLQFGKAGVTVVVSREFAEVRTLQVPKVEAAELPDIIRFQAQRKFATLSENSVVDFVMLPERPGQEMATALVGGISAEHRTAIESACTAANLHLQHLALRPIEIARYASHSGKLKTDCASMIVCIAEDSVDLLTLVDGQLIQVRSTKLAGEHTAYGQAIKGEIRRSLMAATGELGDRALEQAVVITAGPMEPELEAAVSEACDAPLVALDITDSLTSESELSFATKHAPRLAAIVGATALASEQKSVVIDFQHPKKRPPKERNTRTWILAAAAAALLLGAGLSWIYLKQRGLSQELKQLQSQIADAEKTIELSEGKIEQWNQIQAFLDASPNWLDELAYISERIPDGERIVIQNPVFNVNRDGSATIQITSVRASDSDAISAFEESLRNENYTVKGSEASKLSTPDYPWQASETITIRGKGWSYDAIESASGETQPEASADASKQADAENSAESDASNQTVADNIQSSSESESTSDAGEPPLTEPNIAPASEAETGSDSNGDSGSDPKPTESGSSTASENAS